MSLLVVRSGILVGTFSMTINQSVYNSRW